MAHESTRICVLKENFVNIEQTMVRIVALPLEGCP